MTRFGIVTAAVAAVAAATLAAAAAPGGTAVNSKTVRFTGSYSGRAVVRVSGSTADILASATGKGSPVGTSKFSGKGIGRNAEPCPTFVGNGVLTAADKSSLNFVILPGAKSCPGAAPNESLNQVTGQATFKGGTGKYKKARGSFKFTGIYDRGKGTFTVKFAGKLTF